MLSRSKQISLLEDVENVAHVPRERGGPGYTKWELDFIESISEQLKGGCRLSEKQEEKLRELWGEI